MALGAPPWERPQNYVRNSPSFHFDDVRAALLLVAGTADSFTIRHMDLAYLGLKRSAKEVEYRRYRGEGPVSFRCGAAVRYRREELDRWLQAQEKLTGRGDAA